MYSPHWRYQVRGPEKVRQRVEIPDVKLRVKRSTEGYTDEIRCIESLYNM